MFCTHPPIVEWRGACKRANTTTVSGWFCNFIYTFEMCRSINEIKISGSAICICKAGMANFVFQSSWLEGHIATPLMGHTGCKPAFSLCHLSCKKNKQVNRSSPGTGKTIALYEVVYDKAKSPPKTVKNWQYRHTVCSECKSWLLVLLNCDHMGNICITSPFRCFIFSHSNYFTSVCHLMPQVDHPWQCCKR